MSKANDSINSIILVVAFLALTAIATVLYGGSEEQRAKMENNWFYQKGRLVFDTVFVAAQGILAINLNKNTGLAPAASAPVSADSGFWSNMATRIKDEWNNSNASSTINVSGGSIISDVNNNSSDINNILDWQKTDTGAELIFKPKSGVEYKLPLPFKFLSQ